VLQGRVVESEDVGTCQGLEVADVPGLRVVVVQFDQMEAHIQADCRRGRKADAEATPARATSSLFITAGVRVFFPCGFFLVDLQDAKPFLSFSFAGRSELVHIKKTALLPLSSSSRGVRKAQTERRSSTGALAIQAPPPGGLVHPRRFVDHLCPGPCKTQILPQLFLRGLKFASDAVLSLHPGAGERLRCRTSQS
jgi:hypothetical protein